MENNMMMTESIFHQHDDWRVVKESICWIYFMMVAKTEKVCAISTKVCRKYLCENLWANLYNTTTGGLWRWSMENTWRENRFEYFWIISNLGGHAYIVLYNTVWRVTKNDQQTKRVYLCLSYTSAFIESLIFCIQQNNTCFYNTKNNMK